MSYASGNDDFRMRNRRTGKGILNIIAALQNDAEDNRQCRKRKSSVLSAIQQGDEESRELKRLRTIHKRAIAENNLSEETVTASSEPAVVEPWVPQSVGRGGYESDNEDREEMMPRMDYNASDKNRFQGSQRGAQRVPYKPPGQNNSYVQQRLFSVKPEPSERTAYQPPYQPAQVSQEYSQVRRPTIKQEPVESGVPYQQQQNIQVHERSPVIKTESKSPEKIYFTLTAKPNQNTGTGQQISVPITNVKQKKDTSYVVSTSSPIPQSSNTMVSEYDMPIAAERAMNFVIDACKEFDVPRLPAFDTEVSQQILGSLSETFEADEHPGFFVETVYETAALVKQGYFDSLVNPLIPQNIWQINTGRQTRQLIQSRVDRAHFQAMKKVFGYLYQLLNLSGNPEHYCEELARNLHQSFTDETEDRRAFQAVRNFIYNYHSLFC